ncbi:MAG: aldo/keto reductase [SAR202 cluster bacterium]|nr:aldo/keto reductase [SAR202 cluster bacterium]
MSNQLPTATLGRTGLEVTRLGFGTALSFPGQPHWTEQRADRLMNAVLDMGINFIDTAYDYIDSEEWIGRYLGQRNSEFYLATKSGCTDTRPDENNSDHVWTRDNAFRSLGVSLQRLGSDSVDIMQYHNPTVEECEAGNLVDALNEMRDQGKVRWIGVSTTLPDLAAYLDWGVFDVMQIPYSALERKHEDWITRAAEQGVGIIIRGGVAKGESGVGRGTADAWKVFEDAGLDELLEEGESRSAFVLRFTLTHPHAHTIIVGTTKVEHLRENVDAVLRGPLSPELYAEVKRRLDTVGESPEPLDVK